MCCDRIKVEDCKLCKQEESIKRVLGNLKANLLSCSSRADKLRLHRNALLLIKKLAHIRSIRREANRSNFNQ